MSLSELVLVLLVALIVLGPKRLPEAAKWLGRLVGQGQKMLEELSRSANFSNSSSKTDSDKK